MANLEDQFKLAELMSKPTTQGGMSYGDRPNPYGLRAFPTDGGYGGEMMPKTSGWAGEIPTLTGDKMTELSLGGEKGQLFHPMLYKGITPEEIEVVKDYEAGLRDDNDPLVKAVKAKAEAEARKLVHMHQSPFKDLTPKMADGGKIKNLWKKYKESDIPLAKMIRGEHMSADDLAKDFAMALEDAVKHPEGFIGSINSVGSKLIKPSMITELKNYIKDAKGEYGAQRVERAADLVPNLEKQYSLEALKSAFDGDNAKSLMVMHPKDFEKFAKPLPDYYGKPIEGIKFEGGKQIPVTIPPEERYYNVKTGVDESGVANWDQQKMNPEDYLDHLGKVARDTGFDWLPYLTIGEETGGTFRIAGHEGRHRNRALNKLGDEATLINLLPQNIREGLPRRYQEDYQEGLKKLLGPKPKVRPEDTYEKETRRMIDLPEFFADGGSTEKKTSFVDPSSPLSVGLDEWLKGDAPLARIMRGEGKKIIEDLKKPAKPMTEQEMTDLAMNFGPLALGTIEGKLTKELGKRVAKYTKKEAIQGDLRHMPFEEALPLAEKGVHLKQDPSGQFVGAPRGVKSMRDINKLRSEYDKMVEEGALGGDWYERAQQFHKEYTPSKEASSELSRANALFSAQADPISNLGFTLQAHNALEAGAPQKIVRTGPQASRYYKALEEGKDIPLGQKTDIYAKYIDPNLGIGSTGVNDFRHARNFGYTQIDKETGKAVPITRGLSPQEHAFLDAETILATERANKKKLLGKSDWNPEEVQAAPWVLQKAQSLMKSSPDRFPTIEDAFAEANKTYLEGAPKYTAFNTYEQIPYSTSGHLTGMEKIPLNLKEEFSKASQWVDQFGKDILSQKMGKRHGLLTGKTQEGLGSYTNPETGITEFNPQFQSRSLVAQAPSKEGPIIQPQSQALMDAMSALRGYIDVQGASPWIKPLPGSVTPSTSLHLKLNKSLSENEMKDLTELAKSHGFEGVVDLGKEGVLLGFNQKIQSGQDLAKLLKGGLRDKLYDSLPDKIKNIERVRTQGGYKSFEDVFGKQHEGSGKATQRLFDYLSEASQTSPDVVKRFMESDPELSKLLENMNKRDIEASSKYAVGEPRKDVLKAREIISKSGLSGLKKALEENQYLPATLAIPLTSKKKDEK